MRYYDIDGGILDRASELVVQMAEGDEGDMAGFFWAFSLILGGLALGLGLGISSWFFLMFIPLVVTAFFTARYFTGEDIGGSCGDGTLNRALSYYYDVNDDLRGYARPLVENIKAHASTHGSQSSCERCTPRLRALQKLTPAQVMNDDDLDAVNNLLEIRKELGF